MLVAGSVTVSPEGDATGDGLALELFNAELAVSAAAIEIYTELYDLPVKPDAKGQLLERMIAAVRANAQAAAIVTYLTTNAEVSVSGVELGAGTAGGTLG